MVAAISSPVGTGRLAAGSLHKHQLAARKLVLAGGRRAKRCGSDPWKAPEPDLRSFRGIEMSQPSRTDLQRHKYINHAKANRHYGEEITSYDCIGVIFQEGGPALVS